MDLADRPASVKVGQGPGQPQNSVPASGGQMQLGCRFFKKGPPGAVGLCDRFQKGSVCAGIGPDGLITGTQAYIPLLLQGPGDGNPGRHSLGRFTSRCAGQVCRWDGGNIHMQVDTVHKRP